MSHISAKQIRHLLDLDQGGPGLGAELQAFFRQVTSGGVAGKSGDPRVIQAKRLWDRGFGCELELESFDAYLATIPQIPEGLLGDDPELPLLSLADPRLALTKACRLIGIPHEELGYSDGVVVPFSDRYADPKKPFWLRHDDGRPNKDRRPDHCRDKLTGDTLTGTALVGIMAYLHHPEIVVEGEHVIDLPGSVHRGSRAVCAYLKVWDGRVRLHVSRSAGIAGPDYGSLCFRRK